MTQPPSKCLPGPASAFLFSGYGSHLFFLCGRMNEETRKLFSDLGSKNIKDVAFRDSWVFVGAKGVQNKSPFEQVPVERSLAVCPPLLHNPLRTLSAHAAAFPEF